MTRRKRILLILLAVVLVPAVGVGITAVVAPQVIMNLLIPPPPAPEPPPAPVKFSVENTEIGKFLDSPIARKWVDKYFPGFRNSEQLPQTRRLTFLQVQPYFADIVTPEAIAALKAKVDPLPALPPIPVYSTGQTELGTLLDDAEAKAIVDKHLPGFTADERLSMARPFTLVFLQSFIPDVVTDERCAAMDKEFEALAEAKADAMAKEMNL